MISGKYYLMSFHALNYQGEDFSPSQDLVRYISGVGEGQISILASTLIDMNFNYSNKRLNKDPFITDIGFKGIEAIKEVPLEDFPLYIGWAYTSKEFHRLIKGLLS